MDRNARIDLHTHSFFSDGDQLPSEMLRRGELLGYGALAITDHADASNLDELVVQLIRFARDGAGGFCLRFIPGVEFTHVPPAQIAALARRARDLGARLVVVHGESPVEQVASGTNRAAIDCPDVDILAHPGFISLEEAAQAAENGTYLELTSKSGHCITNGHVARVARLTGARLVVNTDAHRAQDMMGQEDARRIAYGAGLDEDEVEAALTTHARTLLEKALGPSGAAS